MGKLIRPDGTTEIVRPANGREFTLEELHGYVGGWIELVRTISGRYLVINEEGKLLGLPVNRKATDIACIDPNDVIVGNAVFCEEGEVS